MLLTVLCDLGPVHGVGHLMRCVALAEEFAHRGFDVAFVADVDSVPFAAGQLEKRGFGAVPPPATSGEYAALLDRLAPTVVLIDSYHLPVAAYEASVRRWPTVAMVDGDPAGRPAHVYVDQNLGAEHDDWAIPAGSVRLAGLDYALQRDQILDLRDAPREAERDPLRVFAFFGGTDAFGAGPVLTDALVRTRLHFDLTVVAPASWERTVEPGPGQRVRLVGPTGRLADEVVAADVVVSAAGTSSWELLCLRAACGLVAVADNQLTSYHRIVETGAVVGLGELDALKQDPDLAVPPLTRLLADTDLRRRLREGAGELVDGRGRRRVADAVIPLVGSLPAPG